MVNSLLKFFTEEEIGCLNGKVERIYEEGVVKGDHFLDDLLHMVDMVEDLDPRAFAGEKIGVEVVIGVDMEADIDFDGELELRLGQLQGEDKRLVERWDRFSNVEGFGGFRRDPLENGAEVVGDNGVEVFRQDTGGVAGCDGAGEVRHDDVAVRA